MLSGFEKCESCGYEHGNMFTGECAACCFFSKYTSKQVPTMWERIKDELNSFAEKWTLKFYTYIFGNNTYSIRFSYIASNGRRHGYSKIVNLNDVEDWLDFTNKIENEVVNKLGLNSVAYNIYISTRNPYYDPRVGDVAGMYPRFKFDTDDAEKTAKEFLNNAYGYNKMSPIMDIASMYPYSDYIEDKDKSSAYPNTMQSFVMLPRSGKSIANLINEIMEDRMNRNKKLTIKNVIFNNPATIVMWSDGTKTVVKVQGKERFNKEKGLAMAISKKFFGNEGNYYEEFKKWI